MPHSIFFSIVVENKLLPNLGQFIWQCNLSPADVSQIVDTKTFWAQVLIAWCHCNHAEPDSTHAVLEQVLWCNALMRVGKNKLKDIIAQNGYL